MAKNECFVCGDGNEKVLQQHHVVPKRYGGSDRDENLVWLCASCHQAIEKLYDDSFYQRLGVDKGWQQISFNSIDSVESLMEEELYFNQDTNTLYRYKGTPDLRTVTNKFEFSKLDSVRRTRDVSYDKDDLEKLLKTDELVHVESQLLDKTVIERLSQ